MRLTKHMKEMFVKAVMQDVPKVDNYDTICKTLNDIVRATNKPEINKLYDQYPDLFSMVRVRLSPDKSKLLDEDWEFSRPQYFHTPPHYKLTESAEYACDLITIGVVTEDQYNELINLLTDERNDMYKRGNLESKLMGAIAGCNSIKQLRDALPEFEKYIPREEKPISKNLPVIANIVTDFTAAGWPKAKEQVSD